MLTSEHLKGYCNKIGHSIKQLPFFFLAASRKLKISLMKSSDWREVFPSQRTSGCFLQIEAALSGMVKLTVNSGWDTCRKKWKLFNTPSVCSRERGGEHTPSCSWLCVRGAEASLQLVLSVGARRKTTRLDLFDQSPVKHEFVVIGMTS